MFLFNLFVLLLSLFNLFRGLLLISRQDLKDVFLLVLTKT